MWPAHDILYTALPGLISWGSDVQWIRPRIIPRPLWNTFSRQIENNLKANMLSNLGRKLH